jgi:hypothetical protein
LLASARLTPIRAEGGGRPIATREREIELEEGELALKFEDAPFSAGEAGVKETDAGQQRHVSKGGIAIPFNIGA